MHGFEQGEQWQVQGRFLLFSSLAKRDDAGLVNDA
jgi:hypothetical protein